MGFSDFHGNSDVLHGVRDMLARGRFPQGVILLTGTGIIPPDEFSLASEDRVNIDITGIGRLSNYVEQAG